MFFLKLFLQEAEIMKKIFKKINFKTYKKFFRKQNYINYSGII